MIPLEKSIKKWYMQTNQSKNFNVNSAHLPLIARLTFKFIKEKFIQSKKLKKKMFVQNVREISHGKACYYTMFVQSNLIITAFCLFV